MFLPTEETKTLVTVSLHIHTFYHQSLLCQEFKNIYGYSNSVLLCCKSGHLTSIAAFGIFLMFSIYAWWWLNQPQYVVCFVLFYMLCVWLLLRKYICNWKHTGDVSPQNTEHCKCQQEFFTKCKGAHYWKLRHFKLKSCAGCQKVT
jgi:hypothetical protein